MRDETTAQLQCQCGLVRGMLREASPKHVNRVICYCDDCQMFATYLGRPDLVDSCGGSDIIQTAAGNLLFTSGQEQIRGVRLSADGSYRWYSNCCKTPLGNMASFTMPAIGIPVAPFLAAGEPLSLRFGEPIGAIRGEYAIGAAPRRARGVPLSVMARAVPKVLFWKMTGKGRGNPFTSSDGLTVRYSVDVLPAPEAA